MKQFSINSSRYRGKSTARAIEGNIKRVKNEVCKLGLFKKPNLQTQIRVTGQFELHVERLQARSPRYLFSQRAGRFGCLQDVEGTPGVCSLPQTRTWDSHCCAVHMIAAKRTLHVYIACTLLSGFCCSAPTCVHSNMHRSVIHRGDLCAHSMQTSKVALLFLTRGELPLEPLWRRWFEDIDGLVYRGCRPDAAKAPEDCQTHLQHTTSGLTCGGPIASQHLFNVYVAFTLLFAELSQAKLARKYTRSACVRRYVHPAMGLDHFQENSIFYGVVIGPAHCQGRVQVCNTS